MRKLTMFESPRSVLGCWLIAAFFVLGNIATARAGDSSTVEGVWIVVSATNYIDWLDHKLSITRKGDIYEVKWLDGPKNSTESFPAFSGSNQKITNKRDRPVYQKGDEGDGGWTPSAVEQKEMAGKTYPTTNSFTLSSDGSFLSVVDDSITISVRNGHYAGYEPLPGFLKATLKRVSGPPAADKPNVAPPKNASIEVGPSRDEAAIKERHQEAYALNEQAVQYYKDQQWQKAVDKFEAALDRNPDDATIRANYKKAVAALAAQNAAPQATPLTSAPPAGATGGHTALDQAHTNNQETRQGLDSPKLETMKEQSNKVFDNPVPLQSSGINPAVNLRNVGKAPAWPAYVQDNKDIREMQKSRDDSLAIQQKKDAELAQIRQQIEAEPDSAKKGDLMVKAAQLKAESSRAEYDAAVKDKDIQTRAKLLIDTHVEEASPTSGDPKTSPPATQPTSQ